MNTHADKRQDQKSQSVTNTIALKQGSDMSAFQFTDNRHEVVAQQNLINMANKASQANQAAQLMAIANQTPDNTFQLKDTVVQRNKHKKRFLNVVSLGLRKAYTYHQKKKLANAAQNVPPIQAPIATPEDQFVTAYEKSRYYQKTHPVNLPSIEEHGLLNHNDRIGKFGRDVAGMSSLGGEYAGDEKKGVFLGPKHLMKENKMTENVARAYLPAERTKIHHWHEEETTPPDEMYLDEKFRGGAVITKNSIPPEQVTTGKMSDLMEDDDPKLQSILAAVGSQYEGQAPDYETMKAHLREAINKRRLSNAAFDNM